MIVHVSVQVLETQTYDDVETTEQAIERFVADRGFQSLEAAALAEGLTVDEYRESLIVEEYSHDETALPA